MADARGSSSDAARADARTQWLGAVETALPDDDNGLSAKVGGLVRAARIDARCDSFADYKVTLAD